MEKKNEMMTLPIIALRGISIFPFGLFSFEIGRDKSIKALDYAMDKDQYVFVVTQKDMNIEFPFKDDLYKVGTICKVKQSLKTRDKNIRVLVEGVSRGRIIDFSENVDYFFGRIQIVPDLPYSNKEELVIFSDMILEKVNQINSYKKNIQNIQNIFELKLEQNLIIDTGEPDEFSYNILNKFNVNIDEAQNLLEEVDVYKRLTILYSIAKKQIDILDIKKAIEERVNSQLSKNQKEYHLREQLKAIQKELGEDDRFLNEIEEFRKKLDELNLNNETHEKIEKEINKYSRMSSNSSEAVVTRNYIESLLDLPWNKYTVDNEDINKSIEILEAEHFGLKDVKERIVEFLAVRKLSKNLKAPIICLLGPPGVGKTSIAKSIANAMGRKFARISLGGVRDEAEIRGHRRTYIGAIPGRIINAINEVDVKNPVFLLDEIDKMASDFRGDPASAMLEVLDPEQNKEFVDHYLEVPFDLSQVVFITTANNIATIPRPLLDRMDIIQISGYTDLEKLEIAKRYLIKKQSIENGLSENFLKFTDDNLKFLINNYTRESGVRNLERKIGKIARKVAVKKVKNKNIKAQNITIKAIKDYLGKEIKRNESSTIGSRIGEATGLAWTQVGGETLNIEVSTINGNGKIELTGQLGEVMKESARTAMTYIRTIANKYKLEEEFYKKKDIHIHIPEGAIPKDGPSAGITLATSILSSLSEIPIKSNLAMTGEITLRGRVLAVGGIKEKVLAAYRAGITNVILPIDNKADYDEIPDEVKDKIKFTFAETMKDVLNVALERKGK